MKPAIIVILDGVNYRSYTKLRKLGKLPFIDELSKEGVEIKKCCTVFPSATVSGHASISTASHPGDHELVGQSWYDRKTGEFIGYDFELTLPDNWIDASMNLSDRHLGGVKTGFEIVKEHGIKSFSVDLIRRGADLKFSFITPGYDRDVSGLAKKFMFLRRFARHKSRKGKNTLKKIITKVIPFHIFQNEIAAKNTIRAIKLGCRFGVTWFMETDAASHIFGPESFEGTEGKPFLYDSLEDALKDADEELEKLYRNITKIAGEPVMAVLTDHGQSKLRKGKKYHVDLTEEFAKFDLNAFTNIDYHEYRERTGKDGDVVIAVSGPRMAHVYAIKRKNDVFEALKSLECVDQIIFRDGGEIKVYYNGEVTDLDSITLPHEKYPFAKIRIEGLMRSSRCGDFVITAKDGYEFERADHMGAHGSLNFDDSMGFAVIHIPNSKEKVIEGGMTTDVLPLVLKSIGCKSFAFSDC